jgi:hypothetical protein
MLVDHQAVLEAVASRRRDQRVVVVRVPVDDEVLVAVFSN